MTFGTSLRVILSRIVYRIAQEKFLYSIFKLFASPLAIILAKVKASKKKLFIVYDLEVNSPSYNFIHFIYASQVYANRHGYNDLVLVICADNRHSSRKWKPPQFLFCFNTIKTYNKSLHADFRSLPDS